MDPLNEKYEKLSTAVSLSVLEIDFYPKELIPAFLLANLMSPALWQWRLEKSPYDTSGSLLSTKNRLNKIQRFFHHFTFTILPDEPGGDPWGLLDFEDEKKRFGAEFISRIRNEYDVTFKELLEDNPDSQFGQIINEPYYKNGFFPRLKNETIEVMNSFSRINEEGKSSGKCIGLGMLWAASLVVWGRFPIERVFVIGNRAHMFVYLDVEDGHLFNNTKWFSTTRINNQSELSEFVRFVTSGKDTTFFYNPKIGICHCITKTSQIPKQEIETVYKKISSFVSTPLKHPDPEKIHFVQPEFTIPDPIEHDTAVSYQDTVISLAKKYPGSICDLALYAFRMLDVPHPQVYVCAALRDYHVKKLAQGIATLSDALSIIENIPENNSIFMDLDRIAMPDETLYFKTGSHRDKALLLYILLQHSLISDMESMIGFSDKTSFVFHQREWINLSNLNMLTFEQPATLHKLFNRTKYINNNE